MPFTNSKVPGIIFYIILIILVQSCGKKVSEISVTPGKLNIQNYELVRYAKFINGEKTHTDFFVTVIDYTNRTITTFINMNKAGEESVLPENLSNYQDKITVSMDRGTLLDEEIYYKNAKGYNLSFTDSSRFPDRSSLKIDYENNIADYVSSYSNNGQEGSLMSRIHFKKGYPVWSAASLLFVGCRFMDTVNRGMFYIMEPAYIKEPVLACFKRMGKEVIETKAGRFNTIKLGFSISDRFLGRLLDSYTRMILCWIEDSPRALVVKTQAGNDINIIEEISIWRKFSPFPDNHFRSDYHK